MKSYIYITLKNKKTLIIASMIILILIFLFFQKHNTIEEETCKTTSDLNDLTKCPCVENDIRWMCDTETNKCDTFCEGHYSYTYLSSPTDVPCPSGTILTKSKNFLTPEGLYGPQYCYCCDKKEDIGFIN